jgi:hypothetical protein
VIEYLPGKSEALSPISSIAKGKKKERKKEMKSIRELEQSKNF